MSSTHQSGFVRVLGRKEVLALAFGAMIGWGWIVMTGEWIRSAGSLGSILAFLIGGLAIILIGLTYAELAAAMPQAGGEHSYSYRALGHFSSFICTWAIVLGYISVVAFEAVALPTVVDNLFPGYQVGFLWNVAGWDVYASWVAVGMAGSLIMMMVNYFGVTTASLLQKVVVLLIVVVGVMFISGALFTGETANMEPLLVGGSAGVMTVLIMVPFMFVGFDVIPQAAEEVNLPPRDIGKLLIVSVVMAVVFYALMILGVSLALPVSAISADVLTVPQAMQAVYGAPWAAKLMIMAGLAGIITSWNAFYIGGSRAIYALAHSGMLPAFLGKLHGRYRTPTNAILLIGLISTFAPLLGRKALVWFVDAGSLAIVIAYLFVAISFVVLRLREPNMPRPFKVAAGLPVGILAVVLSLALTMMYMPFSPSALIPVEWALFISWMVIGLILYGYARNRYGVAYTEQAMRRELS
ncbi:amino acid permease [Pseudomonas duriflava]|uniref:Amino acid permease n=1 Tax=Pseudomonas duriflava TaxID=459528 RepID=A0A562QDM6_9PSED|nr:APC family permease [Pseudomonas duriflava]TWI54867.1 amino acid permease [Pseudomonas duriflava]